jgi:hypothetical protein
VACRMNPLGLDPLRFTVACTEDGEFIAGFGQLVQHGDKICELRSLYVREEHRCAFFDDIIVKPQGRTAVL